METLAVHDGVNSCTWMSHTAYSVCMQVIPGGQPHAGGLVRHMRYFHTTADNYRAHVTQQQVLMMTPAGSLVVQIKQSLQVLNKLSLGEHHAAVWWLRAL